MEAVDRLGELLAGRHALVAEFQSDHALRALHAIGFGAAQEKVGDDGAVADQLAAHSGCLAVVNDLCRRAVAKVLLPRSTRQRIKFIVDQVGAQRD